MHSGPGPAHTGARQIRTREMNFPPPTDRQARILWMSVTTLAIGVIIALAGALAFGIGWLAQQLSSVLLPLAVAGILAFLLDPVVDFLEHRGLSRTGSIIIVFTLAAGIIVIFLATVIPQIVIELTDLARNVPDYWDQVVKRVKEVLEKVSNNPEWGNRIAKATALMEERAAELGTLMASKLPVITAWMIERLGRAASWVGLMVGFALVPVYVFYFLLEKKGITLNWTNYIPIQEPAIKKEFVFFINSVSDALIVFFRGQVLVAMCVGTLTAIGFTAIGLNYGLLLGVMTGALGIIPYLGVMMSFVPAVIIGIVQFGDWRVGLVVGVFVTVQFLEGMVISPKIIGDRVGMHPLTVIIAVITGTTLMGGIVGGILAIPITAVLRALMFRYVWVKREQPESADVDETPIPAD
ncbi:AI-2E family transporter [bacterium]|nr:AI-2E family transporter [bacterium]